MSKSTTQERDKMVSMRVPQAEWDLIDRAATACGKSRTAFVLDAAKQQAADVLKDRTSLTFNDEDWRGLVATLDAPVRARERKKIAQLLGETPLWERG